PDDVLFAVPDDDGAWCVVSAARFRDQVVEVAKGLVESGIEPGQRVGLMSRTRYEWTLFDYAIWTAGAVTVPVYETSSPEQARWIVPESSCAACVTEARAHTDTVEGIRAPHPELTNLGPIDLGAVAPLTEAGAKTEVDIEARRTSAGADSLAAIVYT